MTDWEPAPLATPLSPALPRAPAGLEVERTVTLRPVVRAWATRDGRSLVVAREAEGPHLAELREDGLYRRLGELPLPAHRIVPVAGGWTWTRCWPAQLSRRAGGRLFGRELLPVAPDGSLRPLLTAEGPLVQLLPAGGLVLVATGGGALSAFAPDGAPLWRRPIPGWPASPERRVWSDEIGHRIWVAERGGVVELDREGRPRWEWRPPDAGARWNGRAATADLEEAAQLLGVASRATPEELRKAFRRRALETHPDRHPDLPDAEERFKAASRAFRLLTEGAAESSDTGRPGSAEPAAAAIAVSDCRAAGPDGVWMATRDGAWFRLGGAGEELGSDRLPRRSPVTLAVDAAGTLVAAGQEGALRLAGGQQLPMPAGWDYELEAAESGLVIALGRQRLATVAGGALDVVAVRRPAEAGWTAGRLALFFEEGDAILLRPRNPSLPGAPP